VNRVITLTTDFGWVDGFVGTMKGVILSINPEVTLVDITHGIAPQNLEQGAFLFAQSARYFPAESIHVVVVDPGVGSARRPIALQVGETVFVAPDNGILTQAIAQSQSVLRDERVRAVHLNQSQYWLPRVSNTFHGRDLFAPVAAHLSLGVPLEALGNSIDDWVRLPVCAAAFRAGDQLDGRVLHIDRFGNLITNIDAEALVGMDRTRINVRIAGRQVHGLKGTYADASSGQMVALIGSGGQLEVALRDGNAAAALGVHIGDDVFVMLDMD
jgi:S-adenosylmethionine hydrolase